MFGNLYQNTEAFCHKVVKFSRTKNIRNVECHLFGQQDQENLEDIKIARKNMGLVEKRP